jgi:hypothetical protein
MNRRVVIIGGGPAGGAPLQGAGDAATEHQQTGETDTSSISWPETASDDPAQSSSPVQGAGDKLPPRRRRRQSQGPARPGRVDVGNVNRPIPESEYQPRRAAGPKESEENTVSPMWSELIEPTPPPATTSTPPAGADDVLLDDTTLGGRRAKRYDMTEDIHDLTGEIQEITEGGGTVYRGRRARRRPDSA